MAIVSQLTTYNQDNSSSIVTPSRTGNYLEAYQIPITNKELAFADEGSYFNLISPTSGTGITMTINTSLLTTAPMIYLFNGTTKRLYVQSLTLVINTASTTGTTGGFTLVPFVDTASATTYTSGGTALTVGNSYAGSTAVSTTGLQAYAGALTTLANTSAAINYGDICFRYSTADIVQDHYDIMFGSTSSNGPCSSKPATLCDISRIGPPIVVPPNNAFKVFQWRATQNGAAVAQVRMGVVLR